MSFNVENSSILETLKEKILKLMPHPAADLTAAMKTNTGLEILHIDTRLKPVNCFLEPKAVFVIQGAKRITIGGYDHECREGSSMVTAVGLPVSCRILNASFNKPFLSLAVSFDPVILKQCLKDLKDCDTSKNLGDIRAISFASQTPQLCEILHRMLSLADNSTDAALLAPLLHHELYLCLLKSPHGCHMQELLSEGLGAGQIAKAVNLLRHNVHQQLNVEDLAQSVHMAPSTFYRNFKKITCLSPLQFHKYFRLCEAKQLMLSGMNATRACFSVGYASCQQFSRDYKQYFGNPPAKDIKEELLKPK